jgi:hypothetical protein
MSEIRSSTHYPDFLRDFCHLIQEIQKYHRDWFMLSYLITTSNCVFNGLEGQELGRLHDTVT